MKPVVICGPTASGKTKLAIELALLYNGEIISADSMQIYKGMDVGTSKATLLEQSKVKHYMIDVAEPGDEFSAALYSEMAAKCVSEIESKGKTPFICGGTGLYINALISGASFPAKPEDPSIRSDLMKKVASSGVGPLLSELERVDPDSAKRLHPADIKRIVRALEVYYASGKTVTQLNEESRSVKPRYDPVFIGIMPASREILYDRINERVDQMIRDGLVTEVESLYKSGKLKGTAAQAIGYKELLDHIKGAEDLSSAVETIKRKTRNYAKRQLTWFRADKRINFIEYDKGDDFDSILRKATLFLSDRV
ncbi:MAG: tRNA (adenosine(37)-N6)-dimethylallyltransferase MiaA [Clostridia bacterium]|nr:tRNA (adenosine(37)-N6)-dimethylallyltransferase MiaA [Clostridia bacterium]